MKRSCLPVFLYLSFFSSIVFAQRGKNGPETVSSTVVVNEYTWLTADAAAGNTSITVANSGLNSHNRFSASLSAGDLIMIIQMQGASIKGKPDSSNTSISTPNDSSWGAILNYNNCGNNEIREVSSVPNGTTIVLSCALVNNYTDSGKVQIVRIPRYASLTINNGGEITCDPWDSAVGGIIAIEDSSNTVIDSGGSIDASGQGFRGGQAINMPIDDGIKVFTASVQVGAEKGESVAGYQSGYTKYGGMYCRASAANGGGGGDAVNSGGGGGSNSGIVANWVNGDGNPDVSNPNYVTAWNLEYSWFSAFTSSGGGRGGYTWSDANQNPLIIGPDSSIWTNDDRRSVGGLGGRPLDYSTGRLFIGGGGGAGHENNSDGGNGGNGGGMIYLISYGTLFGSGMILSDGQIGGNNPVWPGDGPGGAGAGGTIVINSTGNISGVTIETNGGTGGNQLIPIGEDEAEGPGGGGGGGYIATTNSVTEQVNGGSNGTTLSFPTFPPDGATMGGNGITSILSVSVSDSASFTYADTAFCPGDSVYFSGIAPLFSTSGTIVWEWTFSGGSPSASSVQNPSVSYSSSGTYQVRLIVITCSGIIDTVTKAIQITVVPFPMPVIKGISPKCQGLTDTLSVSGGTTYLWGNGTTSNTYITGAINADSTISVVAYNSLGCPDTSQFKISVAPSPTVAVSFTKACINNPVVVYAAASGTGPFTYSWSPGGQTTDSIITVTDTTQTFTVTISNGCLSTSTITVTPDVPPLTACCDKIILLGDDTILVASGANSYQWAPPATCLNSSCDSVKVNPTVTTTYTVTGKDSLGCENQRTITIIVEEPCFNFTVPNVFTPNYPGANGLNNVFYIKDTTLTSWSIIIFDRWGIEMYNSTNLKLPWNGETENGKNAPDGVYYYVINATCQGNTYKKEGFVQLIR